MQLLQQLPCSSRQRPSKASHTCTHTSHTAFNTHMHTLHMPLQVRQCQALVARERGGGEALNSQEQEKVDKMPGW